jgi:thiamine-monophosphate kinase
VTGEDRLIAWLRRQTKERGGDLLGDDAAVLTAAAPVVTVDQQIAGTHFPADLSPATVARRLLAVCLSDLAAMGAEPRYSFLALTMPKGFDPRSFFTALLAACEARGVVLAGGDLARGPALAAALTLCGRRFRRGRILQRSDARPGDAIWLGGTVGESAAGCRLVARGARPTGRGVHLPAEFPARRATRRAAGRAVRRHLEPRAQIELGRWLAGRRRAAAIDISDGLAMDLHRLCRASGVGAEIDVERLPLPAELDRLAIWLEQSPLELALAGGEDYVLLFTLGPTLRPPAEFAARRIGRIVAGRRLTLTEKGDGRPLPATGWDHLRRPGGSSGSPDSE